ncbi:MAG: Crp/Fnr family transcriptional regulator [Bacillota bacterium]|jgi:CRP/FNR family transcriptional regulator|nr:Crp/Fnr family transcriptional regulator [Eubacteriales bacterium]MDI9492839.1 Crp/Fnr family transcriptional regulator [Bacillota bacterium]NLV70063.1 Crp/Fnr family transcriptional regulator [Clostridiales bacterium]HRV32905.1 Crp/Fnr family transcriptional regulator [Anaerovoracaceae bacterium]MDD4286209.1 Crp/Fnr family transcriptional regulator [Eubacteriales bacterium]
MTDAEKNLLLSRHFEPWDGMDEEEKRDLLAHAMVMNYPKGTNLHSGESNCVGLFLILKGSLRTYMLSENGKEVTLYRLSEGDMCVLSASCVLSTITFDVHVDTEQDTQLLLIRATYFEALSERNERVECWAYKLAAERFSDVMWAMQQILFMSMDKRLAIFLWDEMTRTGDELLKITHEQAARYVGSAREVVTRMLKYFASEGIVELSRGGIKILDKSKLRSLTQ